MSTRRYGLRDDQWERIQDLLPGRAGTDGRPAKNNRLFVEAVLYRYRAGIPWRDLPERFGDFRVVHLRHTRWAARGIWKQVLEHLAEDADNEYAMIDSTIVRAHQHSAGARKKGGDGCGKPADRCELFCLYERCVVTFLLRDVPKDDQYSQRDWTHKHLYGGAVRLRMFFGELTADAIIHGPVIEL